jgi:hypothetical protein
MMINPPVIDMNQQFDEKRLAVEYEQLTSLGAHLEPGPLLVRGKYLKRYYTVIPIYNESADPTFSQAITSHAPYTAEVCHELLERIKFNYACFRIMPSQTAFILHQDLDVSAQYNIPVIDNSGSFFLFDVDVNNFKPFTFSPGRLYKTRNDREHTFVNCHHEPRVHIQLILDEDGHYLRGETL